MPSLRSNLVKLAHEVPSTRRHILPLLRVKQATDLSGIRVDVPAHVEVRKATQYGERSLRISGYLAVGKGRGVYVHFPFAYTLEAEDNRGNLRVSKVTEDPDEPMSSAIQAVLTGKTADRSVSRWLFRAATTWQTLRYPKPASVKVFVSNLQTSEDRPLGGGGFFTRPLSGTLRMEGASEDFTAQINYDERKPKSYRLNTSHPLRRVILGALSSALLIEPLLALSPFTSR